jgi:hypothetical protein
MCAPGWPLERFNARQPVTRTCSVAAATKFIQNGKRWILNLNLNFDHTESRCARPL